jgi:hypothetical protein
MTSTRQMFLSNVLARIDQEISDAQSLGIDPGNDDLLFVVANVVSDLYESREKVEAQLMLDM